MFNLHNPLILSSLTSHYVLLSQTLKNVPVHCDAYILEQHYGHYHGQAHPTKHAPVNNLGGCSPAIHNLITTRVFFVNVVVTIIQYQNNPVH